MRLYRAVEADELADVRRYGDYDVHDNSRIKRFFATEAEMDKFIALNPNRAYTKTYIDIPKSRLGMLETHADFGVGTAYAIDVIDFPEFYDLFDAVHEF